MGMSTMTPLAWLGATLLACSMLLATSRKFIPMTCEDARKNSYKKADYEDLAQWWDDGKVKLRAFCAAFSREVRRDESSMLKFYHDCLDELCTAPGRAGSTARAARIADFKGKINSLLARRLQGTAARAKCLSQCAGEAVSVHHIRTSRVKSLGVTC